MNSWYNEIKSMYVIFVNMVIYLIFSFIQYGFSKKFVNTYVLIANITQVFLIFYLSRTKFQNINEKKRVFILFIADTIIFSPIIHYVYGLPFGGVIFNSICVFTALLSIDMFNNHMFAYEKYRSNIKISMILVVVIGIIFNLSFGEMARQIYSIYIIMGTLSILILRESRNYTYKIRSKVSKKINASIIICSLIIMIEPINNIIYIIIVAMKDFLVSILEKITYYPLLLVGNIIDILLNNTNVPNNNIKKEAIKKVLFDSTQRNLETISPLVQLLLKILRYSVIVICILLLGLIIVYLGRKIYNFIIVDNKDMSKEDKPKKEYDEIQKIERKKKKKKLDMLMSSKDSKNVLSIRKIYRKFLKQCTDMKIFKVYMSSTALSNILKVKIKNNKDVDEISKIYNEAKFSNHFISDNMVDRIKKAYEKIKLNVKRINN